MDLQSVSSLILALVGVGGLGTSFVLNKRGAAAQEKQQEKANRLAERVQSFDELESLNDRLGADIERLRAQLREVEEASDRRQRAQAQRCRTQLEDMVTTINALRGVILSEVMKASAVEATAHVAEHLALDHAHDEGEQP